MPAPTLYLDLGSPFAYLALERANEVLGAEPELHPVLLGAIFKQRGYGSWAHTAGREQRVREIESRASRYGLPPLHWPPGWPPEGLVAMRCAVWASRAGALAAFSRAVFAAEFATGADIADPGVLTAAAERAGLDGEQMLSCSGRQDVKDELRALTVEAWEAGVRGVPSLRVGEAMFFGDDQLELAAAHLRGPGL